MPRSPPLSSTSSSVPGFIAISSTHILPGAPGDNSVPGCHQLDPLRVLETSMSLTIDWTAFGPDPKDQALRRCSAFGTPRKTEDFFSFLNRVTCPPSSTSFLRHLEVRSKEHAAALCGVLLSRTSCRSDRDRCILCIDSVQGSRSTITDYMPIICVVTDDLSTYKVSLSPRLARRVFW